MLKTCTTENCDPQNNYIVDIEDLGNFCKKSEIYVAKKKQFWKMIINKRWMFQSVANNIVVKIKCVWNWILLGLGVSYGILDNVIVRFFVRIGCSS